MENGNGCCKETAAQQGPNLLEMVLTLQNTVLNLQGQLSKIGEVVNNVSGYAQKIDQAAGMRIAALEQHCGIVHQKSEATPVEAAPVEAVEAKE